MIDDLSLSRKLAPLDAQCLMHKILTTHSSLPTFNQRKICFVFFLNLFILFGTQAQDQTNFTQSYLNPYLLNSSYVGSDGQPSISLLYRKQWMTINGAPTITNLSLQSPLSTRISAGVNVTNDSKGFFNNSVLLFSLGYNIQIQDHAFVRFGISAGGSWNTVDMKKLDAMNDPALTSVLNKNASLAGNAGVSLHVKLFHFGVALPTIFSPSYVSQDAFNVKEVKPFQAFILNASNRFYFNNNKNIFEPYAVYRINTGLPSQFEIAGLVHLDHVVWVGGSYKQDFGISALGGVKLKNIFAIGASYSIQKSGIDELNSPSFEISLNYLFGLHKKGVPVYSFVNAVKEKKLTPATQEAIAARRQQAEALQKKKTEAQAELKQQQLDQKKRLAEQASIKLVEAQNKQLDAQAKLKVESDEKKRLNEQVKLKQEETDRQKQLEEQNKLNLTEAKKTRLEEQERTNQEALLRVREEQARQEEKALALKKSEALAKAEQEALAQKTFQEEQEKLRAEDAARQKQLAIEALAARQEPVPPPIVPAANVPVEGNNENDQEQLQRLEVLAANPTRPVEDTTQHVYAGRHEFVKRGNHEQELEVSEYVIVGVFKSVDNANHFSDGLVSLNFNTAYGYLTTKDLWYVYIFKTTDIEKAQAEVARFSKLFLLRDAWLLTVEP